MNLFKTGDLLTFPFLYDQELLKNNDDNLYKTTIFRSHAEIFINQKLVIKKIRYQRIADHLRKPFYSQAKRETRASEILNKLSIPAPFILGYGINWSPLGPYESILFMKYIPNLGTMKEIILQNPPHERRTKLIHQLLDHLSTMIHAGIYHKDAHMDNILVGPDDRLIWIDNDIAPLKGKREMDKLLKKFLASRLLEDEERDQIFRLKTLK